MVHLMVSHLGRLVFKKVARDKHTSLLPQRRAALYNKHQGPYLQHFIFFVTYECDQQARAFVTGKPFQSVIYHSSLLGSFLSIVYCK
jgi:hypothetical protein